MRIRERRIDSIETTTVHIPNHVRVFPRVSLDVGEDVAGAHNRIPALSKVVVFAYFYTRPVDERISPKVPGRIGNPPDTSVIQECAYWDPRTRHYQGGAVLTLKVPLFLSTQAGLC